MLHRRRQGARQLGTGLCVVFTLPFFVLYRNRQFWGAGCTGAGHIALRVWLNIHNETPKQQTLTGRTQKSGLPKQGGVSTGWAGAAAGGSGGTGVDRVEDASGGATAAAAAGQAPSGAPVRWGGQGGQQILASLLNKARGWPVACPVAILQRYIKDTPQLELLFWMVLYHSTVPSGHTR